MAHYAYLDADNVVTQVIVGKDEGEDGVDWEAYYGAVRTSYNTHGGVHVHGGTPWRYNFAGEGYTFSNAPEWASQGGAFIPPQPYPSWTLNSATALWEPPTACPSEGGPWSWDEVTLSWVDLSAI
jgi:hypothetical protein